MANYYISYRLEWYSINENFNRLDILDSELLADNIKMLMGGATPLLHEYSTDEPFAPVKGSSALVQYANINGETPLTNFYTENDQRFKAIWYQNGNIRFTGFLVQDDCNESLSIHNKINTLSFTDNLGLLKNVGYDQAVTLDPYEFINYKDLICKILAQTGLEIDVQIFSSLALDGSSATVVSEFGVFGSSFANSDGGYRDCYSILEDALKAIRATVYQSNGVWKVVRWAEAIYSGNDIDGAAYEIDGTSIGAVSLNDVANVANLQIDGISEIIRPLKSVTKQFDYKSPSELIRNGSLTQLGSYIGTSTITLEGVSTNNLVYNIPNSVGWVDNYKQFLYDGVLPQIHIIRDATTLLEKERAIVIGRENTSNPATSIGFPNLQFYEINVNKGDFWNFSFEYLPYESGGGTGTTSNLLFAMILLQTETNVIYPLKSRLGDLVVSNYVWGDSVTAIDQGQSWQTTNLEDIVCYFFNKKLNTWNGISMNTEPQNTPTLFPKIKESGKLIIRLFPNVSGSNERYDYYKNLKVTITREITEDSKLKGQINAQLNNNDAKNVFTENINIDDSPRISIAGTILQNTTDFVKPLTGFWKRNYGYTTEKRKLSEITAFEELFNRRKPRTKIDCTLLQSDNINYSSIVTISQFPNKYFIFGQFSYNAKLDSIDCTLYENYEEGETDSDLTNTYTFNYLYE